MLLQIVKDATTDKVPNGGGKRRRGSINCQENGTETTLMMVMKQTINNSHSGCPENFSSPYRWMGDKEEEEEEDAAALHLKGTELVGGCPKFSAPLRAVRFLSLHSQRVQDYWRVSSVLLSRLISYPTRTLLSILPQSKRNWVNNSIRKPMPSRATDFVANYWQPGAYFWGSNRSSPTCLKMEPTKSQS